MEQQFTIICTTAMGLEAVAKNEIKQLGYPEAISENGRVVLQGSAKDVAKLNLWLRTVDRVKLLVGRFEATSFDDLFEGTKALSWEAYLPFDAAFPVSGKCVRSQLYSVPDCQSIVKKAIVERLAANQVQFQKFDESGATFPIEINVTKDIAELTLDTSGSGLHKRGFRLGQGEAPVKETLAAALVLLTNWKPDMPFIDPLCGSGTITLEAAMIGMNIAPGFNRGFAAEHWPIISEKYWNEVREEAEDLARYDQELSISGSDIDHRMIDIAKENAMEAGLQDNIDYRQMQLSDLHLKTEQGVLVTNPPYGERLGDKEIAMELAESLGDLYKQQPSWSFYVITSDKRFESFFGPQATKRRKLFNGQIETQYYQYWAKRRP
ncbi:THUMP domain-containing class I SAM-dependent RNA methyltransferase [Aureibacillus halotolerans]|uniref:Putative N6-adenine-specific DNA methylase n=1 Tax=Aureibacillus halotolerans TaxID=1508390 RepID=A0A4R6U9W0_9BACI|nr:class I SAM-dependent RNA methyltransferase [Aureibacillus halotolerans]TDQ41475.1 putative N6-adenine-specific DNA methylase [Aureibacillus halotolerans]